MDASSPGDSAASMLVAPLSRFSRADLETAGGKGANLGELIRAGLPVPAGMVVTTAAYGRFVRDNGLDAAIGRALAGRHNGDEDNTGATIRAAFAGASIPGEIERAILQAYEQLGQGPVAVRSSATAEDLPEAAFAGQQDTFLNVVGGRALLDAVCRCWASLWSDRAIVYRGRQGLDQNTVKLAVVVQRMVAAETAGVMFTANPVTGARDEIVVDASPGLGEAVVSGLVTPDHLVLRKRRLGWRTVERRLGQRETIVRALPGGGTEQVAGAATARALSLPGRAVRRLVRLGTAIQRHFGAPQDVEWAWAGGRLFILQARPITALPAPVPRPGRIVQMLSAIFAEMFPVRPYPLDLSTWLPALSDAAVEPMFSLIGIEPPPLLDLFEHDDGVLVQFRGKLQFHPTPAVLIAPLRLLGYAIRYNPHRWRADPLLVEALSHARVLGEEDVRSLSWEGLLARVQDILELPRPLAGEMRRRYLPRPLLAAGFSRLLLGLLGHGGDAATLLNGARSVTLDANQGLEDLATRARTEPGLAATFATHPAGELWAALEGQPAGRSFLADVRLFLDRYGHREQVLSTSLEPVWRDAPDVVLGMIKGLAATPAQPEAARPAWQVKQEEVLAHPLLRPAPLRAGFLRLLNTARFLWQVREDTHLNATLTLPLLRRTLLELGSRLHGADVLDMPADVYHLTLDDLGRAAEVWPPPADAAGALRALVARRKEKRAALENRPVVDPAFFEQRQAQGQEDVLLWGTSGSPGAAEGPVRVIHDGSEFGNLRAGEVLVAPYTNPAWTLLFQRASAVVVDGGGAGSHAAIVAREYGIPAVMGTVTGTRDLHDGDRVRVDGSRGVVQRAAEPER